MADEAARYIGCAQDYMRNGELELAADSFELALRLEGESMVALCGLARAQLRTGQVDAARRTVARALVICETDPEALRLQAEVHACCGRIDLAIDKLHVATEADLDRRRYRRGPG